MNKSELDNLFENIYEAFDNLNLISRTEYEYARSDLRYAKLDNMVTDEIPDDEKNRLNDLERVARVKHKNYCDAIMNVRDIIEQAINAMGNIDGHDDNNERLNELQEMLNELPECPSESDFLNITDIDDGSLSTDGDGDDDNDDDEIAMLSDIEGDAVGEPINQNFSLLAKVIEKSKVMKNIEKELKECEDMKNQSKTEMFARRDQQLDISQHQQYQRNLFNKMNELKINYRRVKAEVKGMIQDVLPYLNDDTNAQELMELLNRIDTEDVIEKSQGKAQQVSRIPKGGIPTRQPQSVQQSKIPPPQFTSRIPQVNIARPEAPVRSQLFPPSQPQFTSKLPQPKYFTSKLPQLQSLPHQISQPQSQIPRMQTRIPQAPAYQVSRQPSLSRIPTRPSQLELDVNKEKLKQMQANLKISESIGNVHKVRARPIQQDRLRYVRPDDVNRLKNLSAAQKKNLNKQNKIKAEDAVNRMLDDIDKNLKKLTSKLSPEMRAENEKRDIQSLISSAIRMLFNQLGNDDWSHEQKMEELEKKLKIFIGEINRELSQSRGRFFKPDDLANQQFIQTILNHFQETKNFDNFREILEGFFKKLPLQKFPNLKPKSAKPKTMQHSTPTVYRRPSRVGSLSKISRPAASQKRTGAAVKNVKAKIQNEIENLERTSPKKSLAQVAIKQKLDKFVNTFCKVFLLNQRNRRNKFEIWVKTFRNNIRPILNDLDAFYKSLPYPELKTFDKKQVEQSLDHLLRQVYEQTRKYELTNVSCKDLIGKEMNKLMEQKQLKNINASLSIFLQGIKELMEPYVEPKIPVQQDSSIMQKSQHSIYNRGQQSMLQKLHESNIQKALHRTLMNETENEDESIEYPSFNESLLQQVSVQELKSMYRKMLSGRYKIPNVQGTAGQAMMLEKIEKILRGKVERGMARKRDESYVRLYGRASESFTAPILERLAPSSINIFKRIIGANEILDSIEITDEMLKALNMVLECCEDADENVCKVLLSQHRNEISALDDSLSMLVERIKSLVYNNNIIDYRDELARLDKLHYKLDVVNLKSQLGQKVFSRAECDMWLKNAFAIKNSDDNAATNAAIEYIKNLRYMEHKYILKILQGEIRGEIENLGSEKAPSQAPSSNYLDRIKTVHPYQVISDYDYPHDLIERDILYVACQLTNRNEFEMMEDAETDDDDRNGHMDSLSRHIIQIAQKYQNNRIGEREALRIIGQIFYMLNCIPIDFYQRFIYHKDNEYFGAIRFNKPLLNTAARIETMARRNRTMCAEDKLLYGRQVTLIAEQIERFMFVFDNEFEEIARSFQMLDMMEKNNIKIRGNEVSNNGNGVLANPKAITTESALDGKIDDVQLSLASNQPPIANVANADILAKLDEIESILDKHLEEVRHFENSKIAKIALKYELQPNAINRKNYWQCRGTEIPKWFPGFHTVFPNTNQCRPIAYSMEQILPHAWRMMAPINYK